MRDKDAPGLLPRNSKEDQGLISKYVALDRSEFRSSRSLWNMKKNWSMTTRCFGVE